jgi:basic amino acid/polyamine antiporter, APA family
LIEILGTAFPDFQNIVCRILPFSLFFGLAILNVIGVKQGIGLVKINTVAKLAPLILLALVGKMWNGSIYPGKQTDHPKLGEASLILFFAFMGGDAGLSDWRGNQKPSKDYTPCDFYRDFFCAFTLHPDPTGFPRNFGSNLPNFKEAPLAEAAKITFGPIGLSLAFCRSGNFHVWDVQWRNPEHTQE